jgi:hypothetical protein
VGAESTRSRARQALQAKKSKQQHQNSRSSSHETPEVPLSARKSSRLNDCLVEQLDGQCGKQASTKPKSRDCKDLGKHPRNIHDAPDNNEVRRNKDPRKNKDLLKNNDSGSNRDLRKNLDASKNKEAFESKESRTIKDSRHRKESHGNKDSRNDGRESSRETRNSSKDARHSSREARDDTRCARGAHNRKKNAVRPNSPEPSPSRSRQVSPNCPQDPMNTLKLLIKIFDCYYYKAEPQKQTFLTGGFLEEILLKSQ